MNRLRAHLDVGRAIIALVIALLLFAFVRNEANPSEIASFEVPVDYVDVPPGLLIAPSQGLPAVRVRISGPRDTLSGLRSGALQATVDLRRGRTGVDEYPVRVDLPDPRIRLIDVVPGRVPVRLEEIIERRVPVQVSRTGNVPFGYEVGQIQVDPSEVVVSGSSSVVQRIARLVVDLRLDGVTVNIDGTYGLTPTDAQGQPVPLEGRTIRFTPETVRVRAEVTQQLSYKTVPVRPSITGAPESGSTIEGITVDPATVTVVGNSRALGAVDTAPTQPVDISEVSSTVSRQVGLALGEGVSVVGADTVRVTVRVGPLVLQQAIPVPVTVENLPGGLQVTSQPPTVQVVVRATAAALRGLDPGRIRAVANVAGLQAGAHDVPINVSAPSELTVESVTPRQITVTLAPTQATTAAR